MPFFVKFFGLLKRETHRFCKVPLQTVATPIISSLLYILIFGVSLGTSLSTVTNLPYLSFLVPGLLTMGMIKNAFENASSSILSSKYVNELQDLRTTPLSKQHILWAFATASCIRGMIVAILTFFVGLCFCPLPIAHPIYLLTILITTGFSFGFLGLAIAMRSRSFEQINSINSFVLVPMIYLGGTFFPVERLHPIWQTISHFNPIFYIINGIRYGIIGMTESLPLHSLLVSLTTLTFTYAIAFRSLKSGSAYSRTL